MAAERRPKWMATGRPPAHSTDRVPEQPGARVSSRSRTSRTVAGRAKRSNRPVRRYWADFHQGVEDVVVLGVELEPDGALLPLQLALLAAHGGDAVPEGLPAVLEPGLVAAAHVDDRGRPPRAVVGHEWALGGQQVVELPDLQPGAAQQLPRLPFQARGVHQAMAVREAGADRPADPERAPFIGKEPDDLRPLLEYGHPAPGRTRPTHTANSGA